MAIALRFDEIRVNPGGTVEVFFTYGTTPLPSQASGMAISLANRQEAVAMKNAIVADFGVMEMFRMALAIHSIANADPNLIGATAMAGHTLTADATKPTAALAYS